MSTWIDAERKAKQIALQLGNDLSVDVVDSPLRWTGVFLVYGRSEKYMGSDHWTSFACVTVYYVRVEADGSRAPIFKREFRNPKGLGHIKKDVARAIEEARKIEARISTHICTKCDADISTCDYLVENGHCPARNGEEDE